MELSLSNNKMLPFYFEEFEDDILITNIFREYMFLSKHQFMELISGDIKDDELRNKFCDKKFMYQGDQELVASKYSEEYRHQNEFIFEATSLHIFAVTQNCNLKCVYCQVTSDTNHHKNTYMTKEVALKAVDIALQSPSNYLAFEFQGGEPLINYSVIKEIVNYANEKKGNKKIEYRLVTNLTLMNQEILNFLEENKIGISVSLDGDEYQHNHNRPFKNGKGTFDVILPWIKEIRQRPNIQLSALPTITNVSLQRVDELLRTYIGLEFKNIFIRNLSPFGTASNSWKEIGYTADEFIVFYERVLNKIIDYNRDGLIISENYASMILSKILKKSSINFMDLRSPCGAGIGQIAYNWDGNIFTCDEGRMLAAEGDNIFKIGDIRIDNYQSCMKSDTLKYVLSASVLDNLVSCSDCAYSPICGVCPVYNYKTTGNLFIRMENDYRCQIFKGIYKVIYSKLRAGDPRIMEIFSRWIG